MKLMRQVFKQSRRIEHEVRPEYIKKLMKIQKGKHRVVKDFAKEFGLK